MGRQAQEGRPCPAPGARRRRGAWQAALLAATILSSCFLLTQAQVQILVRTEPSMLSEGEDVTLTPEGNPKYIVCYWYRGEATDSNRIFTYIPLTPPEQQNGLKFTGRESGGPNCSLHIRNVMLTDAGNYTVSKTASPNSEAGHAHIQVLEKLSQPILEPDNFFVKVHTDITFNCSISARSSVTVSWFKDEKPVPAKAVPSEQNRTLTVPDVSKDDEGMYICEARNPVDSARSNPSKVVVDSPTDNGLTAGQIVGIVIGCLLGVALIGVVLYFVLKGTALGRMESHSSNGNISSAPGRNQGVTDTKPVAGEEDIQYTTLAFNANRPPQPALKPTDPSESGTIYSVIKNK